MRDFSCFGDGAITLSSGGGGAASGAALDRSLQAATASTYRVALSSRKELRIKVTWTRSALLAGGAAAATGLAVSVDDGSRTLPVVGTPRRSTAAAQHLLQKKCGSRSFVTEAGTSVAIYWDTAEAKYPAPAPAAGTSSSSSPEPSRDYYLAVVADAELALLLGGGGSEAARDLARRFSPAPRRALLSRREQVRAPPGPGQRLLVHSTRCRFLDDGAEHEVTVACRGDEWGSASAARDGEVSVCVDGKKVVEARRVKWNFRGNRTVVLGDGAVVEVMWDVHDWWFAAGDGGGGAQFMVKARGAADGGRVWMDEELAKQGHAPGGFFLHLQCYRRSTVG